MREAGRLPNLVLTPYGWKLSPDLEAIEQAEKIMLATSDRLGFSPAARPRIHVPPEQPEDPDSPFAQLRHFPVVIPGGRNQPPAPAPRRKRNGSRT